MSGSTVITIGNFDGVHLGHRALLTAARTFMDDDGRLVVLSFDPHPASILRPDAAPGRLTSFDERADLLRAAGADEVIRIDPTAEMMQMEPEEYVEEIVSRFRPSVIAEGPDFRFGRGRSGSVQTLRELQGRHGYLTAVVGPVEAALADQHLVPVSSTMIRWLIERGRMRDAITLLGRPYELVGPIVPGDRRGREIGFPTANLDHGDRLLPADGIYAGQAQRDGGPWRAAAINIGTKPTFGEHPRTCEAHIIGYDGSPDDYGWTMRLRLTEWLRDQIRFPDAASLADQLQRDIARAESLCAAIV